MGAAKHAMMEREENLNAAAHFLVKLGTLSSCEFHGDFYDGDGDLEQAYKTAAYKHKRGEISFSEGMTQLEMTDLLKDAYEDNSGMDVCPSCDHIMGKDD